MILTLNGGSSSLKFALFHRDGEAQLRGQVEGLGKAPKLSAKDAGGRDAPAPHLPGASYEDVLGALIPWLEAQEDAEPLTAVGHRIVHGGDDFADPVRIDGDVLARLEALVPLAPLHQPANIAAIRAVTKTRKDLPQVACFDTAFHRAMPAVATRLALPRNLGLRRYGFHGLSYEFVSGRFAELEPELGKKRVIIAHLGNGASLCALQDGRSVATTMGFSVLDGLVMGTRPGSVDPGALLYLLQARGLDLKTLEHLLYHESGLQGVSGISSDMRTLRASDAAAAREAIELFTYRLIAEIGALTASLRGLDALVFTGGIGEHDAALRVDVCRQLDWLGVTPDPARKAAGQGRISTADSRVAVWVVPTDEEAVIARHTAQVIG